MKPKKCQDGSNWPDRNCNVKGVKNKLFSHIYMIILFHLAAAKNLIGFYSYSMDVIKSSIHTNLLLFTRKLLQCTIKYLNINTCKLS